MLSPLEKVLAQPNSNVFFFKKCNLTIQQIRILVQRTAFMTTSYQYSQHVSINKQSTTFKMDIHSNIKKRS